LSGVVQWDLGARLRGNFPDEWYWRERWGIGKYPETRGFKYLGSEGFKGEVGSLLTPDFPVSAIVTRRTRFVLEGTGLASLSKGSEGKARWRRRCGAVFSPE